MVNLSPTPVPSGGKGSTINQRRTEAGYRVLAHTADTGVEARASSLASLIALLATAMCELMADAGTEDPSHHINFSVTSPTVEDLVVDTLSELLYQSEARDLVFTDIDVRMSNDGLAAEVAATGAPTASAQVTGPQVKAVTYHRLEVRGDGDEWYGRVYFDV